MSNGNAALGLPEGGPPRFESLDAVRGGLAQVGYLADESISGVVYLADRLAKPVLVEGPAGRARRSWPSRWPSSPERASSGCSATRGSTSPRPSTSGTTASSCCAFRRGSTASREEEGPSWSELEEDIFSEDFLLTRPLLEAIRATEPVVLLVDEVDRVELETEALLLEILSEYQVSIPELGTVRATQLPMVFLTSNNTRELSEALKRRCLYLHIDYPDLERSARSCGPRCPASARSWPTRWRGIVRSLRTLELRKAPSVSETIDWARTLVLLGVETIDAAGAKETLHILLKYQADIERASKELLSASPG